MRLFKMYENYINQPPKYSKGCAMLMFEFPEMKNIHSSINPEDVYLKEGKYGLEIEPHITLLYGLDADVNVQSIRKIIDKYYFDFNIIHKISIFDNDEYDVLKFEVANSKLTNINKDLKNLPYESDFPEYNPHLTIGYLKKGEGRKYVEKFEGLSFIIYPSHVVYSYPPNNKVKIKIDKTF